MNLFVGNLSFEATETDIRVVFEEFGLVTSLVIVMDKKRNQSRGFCFLEMPDDQQAQAAIAALNGKEVMGRELHVTQARSKAETDEMGESPVQSAEGRHKQVRQRERQSGPWKKREFDSRSDNARESIPGGSFNRETRTWKRSEGDERPWKKRSGTGGFRSTSEGRGGSSWKNTERKSRPWRKSAGESKRWERPERASGFGGNSDRKIKAWEKPERKQRPWGDHGKENNPWRRTEKKTQSWGRPERKSRPWESSEGRDKPWGKPAGESRPWDKSRGESIPRGKSAGGGKPWHKKSEHSHQFRFKSRKTVR